MAVVEKSVGIVLPEVGLDAADRKIHLRHLPSRRVGVLPINGDIFNISGMILNKLCRLHEHTARTAARIVHATFVGLQHVYQRFDNAGRRIEFAGEFSFRLGKFRKTVLIGASQNIFRVAMFVHPNIRK